LVAARKKQLHEQQAKSSPINVAAAAGKKLSVKSFEAKKASLADRAVKSSTEKLDVDKRAAPAAKKASAAVPDRQLVKASTEKLDSVSKRVSVKAFEAGSKPRPAAAEGNADVARKASQEEAAKSAKTVAKKSSSVNLVLASKKLSRAEAEEVASAVDSSEAKELPTQKKPLLAAVLADEAAAIGSAENLSTRVNLSSASSVTSEQVSAVSHSLQLCYQMSL
jgi:hypothetical protein